MKKYWKIRYDSDIRKKLEFLKVPYYYIEILLDKYSLMIKYLKDSKSNYIYITYTDDEYNDRENKFGWFEYDHEDFFKKRNYLYCGEINLRKEKLKKLKQL